VEGIVFDIQRFALHDGPGIRTTVFLKGCPLECLWCHNPESQAFEPELSFRRERCTECVASAEASLSGLGALQSGPLAIQINEEACEVACPHGAFSVIGRSMTVADVMGEVVRDEAYYHRSGGGLTLSGGEPMAQFEFTLEVLQQARRLGIHTCLDTCGVTSRRRLTDVAPYVDLFLFDYKATDPEEHRRLTGSPNGRILRNLDFLVELGACVRLRCPLVPGVNDSWTHLSAIADLAGRYPALEGVEIMPYHDMAREKAARIDRPYALRHVRSASAQCREEWLDMLSTLGCNRAFIA
jgi:glycyl-radical enzyme activating protein